jgi:hypothetical protein
MIIYGYGRFENLPITTYCGKILSSMSDSEWNPIKRDEIKNPTPCKSMAFGLRSAIDYDWQNYIKQCRVSHHAKAGIRNADLLRLPLHFCIA